VEWPCKCPPGGSLGLEILGTKIVSALLTLKSVMGGSLQGQLTAAA
jgi:hypothetical protein